MQTSESFPFVSVLQDDKDLVPEFVNSDGLTCFIKVGAEADHNYQNYILRGGRSKKKKKVKVKLHWNFCLNMRTLAMKTYQHIKLYHFRIKL